MKFLKWLGLGIGAIVALLAVGIGIVWATFDPNQYKGQITQYVKDKQQRTLVIPGSLSLSFFPNVGVKVGELSLSEFKSEKVFVKLAGAKVSVELLPLLSKQVVVERVLLDGLSANIVRGKNGKFNFDDLTGGGAQAAPAPSGQAQGQALKLDIDSVKIANASISYKDESNGTQIGVTGLNLQTGRIAEKTPTTVDLSAKIEGVKPKASLALGLKGGMTLDLQGKNFAFSNLAASLAGGMQDGTTNLSGLDVKLDADDLRLDVGTMLLAASKLALVAKGKSGSTSFDVKSDLAKLNLDMAGGQIELDRVKLNASGKQGNDPFEMQVNAPRLSVSKTASSGEAITGSLKVSGAQNLEAKFNLSGVSGNAKAFSIANIRLDYNAKNADSAAVGTLSSALTGNLEAKIFELKKIDANIKIDNPNIPAKTVTLPIQGNARADLGKGAVSADIATKFDESSILAKVGMPSLAPPSYTFDIGIDKLNADRYRQAAPSGAQAGGGGGGAEKPIDLSGLKGLTARGTLRVGALQANNVKLNNVVLTLNASGGKVQVAPLSAGLYGGSMNGAASIDANSNSFAFKNNLTGVQVNPLMKDAANQDILEGKGNVVIDVTSSGTLPSAIKKSLNGNFSVKLNDGAIKGINIAERIRNAKSLLGAKKGAEGANKNEKTDFSELSLSANIVTGVATSNDLNLAAPLLRAKGAGQVNIGANTLDYTIRPKLVATTKGQDGRTYEQLSGIEMPVKIFGALDAPQYQPDYAAAAMSAAQSEIGGKLLEKAGGGKAGGLLGALAGKGAAPAPAPATAGAAPAPAPAEEKKKPKDLLKGLLK